MWLDVRAVCYLISSDHNEAEMNPYFSVLPLLLSPHNVQLNLQSIIHLRLTYQHY